MPGLGTVSIVGLEKSYLDGLADAARLRRAGQTLLVLFLGSTIGNFERPAAEEFLRQIRERLWPGDAILLGTDLEKDVRTILRAYDDPAGVTRAFNLNLLARINRELGGDFMLENFEHEARYNEGHRRVEMHLRSKRRQTISIAAAEFSCTLEAGETIWTEACHKFRLDEIPGMAQRAGFTAKRNRWIPNGRSLKISASLRTADSPRVNAIVSFQNVSYRIGNRTLLDGLSFELHAGETLGHWVAAAQAKPPP